MVADLEDTGTEAKGKSQGELGQAFGHGEGKTKVVGSA